MDVLRGRPTNAQPCAGRFFPAACDRNERRCYFGFFPSGAMAPMGRFFTIGGAINWRIADARDGLIVGGALPLDALLERLQLAGQYNDEHALAPVQCDSLRSLNH
jgi:hypothetical protein